MRPLYLAAFALIALFAFATGVDSQSPTQPSRPVNLLQELKTTKNENEAFLKKQTEILAALDPLAEDAQQDRNMAVKAAK